MGSQVPIWKFTVGFCRFHGHEDTIVTTARECRYDETKVQPRVLSRSRQVGHGTKRGSGAGDARDVAEHGILKKDEPFAPLVEAQGRTLFRARGDMRVAFIAKHRHIWPVISLGESSGCLTVRLQCLADPPDQHKLVAAIKMSFKISDRTYSARHGWRDGLEHGLTCRLRP